MSQKSYKNLIAWQKAMELVTAIYGGTQGFPSHEQFGLITQLRRAAVSVPSNIAEGKGALFQPRFREISPSCAGIARRDRNTGSDCATSHIPGQRNPIETDTAHSGTGAHFERIN